MLDAQISDILYNRSRQHRKLAESFRSTAGNGLRLRINKFHFMKPTVELLGHTVDKEDFHDDEKNIERIKDALQRTMRKEL